MVSLKHKFKSAKADSTNTSIMRPSDWNDEHALTADKPSVVLGRDSSVDTAIKELPFDIDAATGRAQVLSTSGFKPAVGTTAQRPATGKAGEMRYNSQTDEMEVCRNDGSWSSFGYKVAAAAAVPVGMIAAFPDGTPPAGWLLCDGASLPKADHPGLFAMIDYHFGGTGATFNLPDYQGRVLACTGKSVPADTAITIRQKLGSAKNTATLTMSNFPEHGHSFEVSCVGHPEVPGNYDSRLKLLMSNGEDKYQPVEGYIGVDYGRVSRSGMATSETTNPSVEVTGVAKTGGGAGGAADPINLDLYQPTVGVLLCIKDG